MWTRRLGRDWKNKISKSYPDGRTGLHPEKNFRKVPTVAGNFGQRNNSQGSGGKNFCRQVATKNRRRKTHDGGSPTRILEKKTARRLAKISANFPASSARASRRNCCGDFGQKIFGGSMTPKNFFASNPHRVEQISTREKNCVPESSIFRRVEVTLSVAD